MAPLFRGPRPAPAYFGNDERLAGGTSPRVTNQRQYVAPAARQISSSRTVCARTRSDCTRLPGFTDDPDDWAGEVDTPCYIVDLISKVTRVAVETVRIVDSIDTRKQRDD